MRYNDIPCGTTTHNSHVHFTHYNDDCYIEYVTRVNGPDDKWHDTVHDVHDAKAFISLRASKPDFMAPITRAYTSQTYTRYRHPKVCP